MIPGQRWEAAASARNPSSREMNSLLHSRPFLSGTRHPRHRSISGDRVVSGTAFMASPAFRVELASGSVRKGLNARIVTMPLTGIAHAGSTGWPGFTRRLVLR